MIVVANAGPIIALAQIGHLDLLRLLYKRLLIPAAVRDEVVGSGSKRAGQAEVDTAVWIETRIVADKAAVEFLRERLDAGESEAIMLALEIGADLLLIDEARGRRVAETRGIKHTGTVGTVITAKKRGLIPAAAPLFDALQATGFYMGTDLYQAACRLAGEE